MTPLAIDRATARRYLLGRQGLWPGRRWQGLDGTAQALRYCEAVQIDPLCVIARNHDLTLHSRVIDYEPDYLDHWCYRERAFFDYGGAIFVYPMDELPYWRVAMQRKGQEPRWAKFAEERPELLKEVKTHLRQRGPLGNRDFNGRPKGDNYRSGKDTGLAMYCLWLRGELMTHSRRNFDRLFDFRENVAPEDVQGKATVAAAEAYFARKALAFRGLSTVKGFADALGGFIERRVPRAEGAKRLRKMIDAGEALALTVEGWPEPLYASGEDAALLDELAAGQVPAAWRPLATTTTDEVTFLAPLDIVSARGRAKVWFGFEYIWEVYKPAPQRRWGYYTLPILFGDQLVARFDSKLDRTTGTLVVNSLWLEDDALADNLDFIGAFARGLDRFRRFLTAPHIDLAAVRRGKSAAAQVARTLNLA